MQHKSSSVTEYAVVDVGVLDYGMCIVPFAVENESNPDDYGEDKNVAEGRESMEETMAVEGHDMSAL